MQCGIEILHDNLYPSPWKIPSDNRRVPHKVTRLSPTHLPLRKPPSSSTACPSRKPRHTPLSTSISSPTPPDNQIIRRQLLRTAPTQISPQLMPKLHHSHSHPFVPRRQCQPPKILLRPRLRHRSRRNPLVVDREQDEEPPRHVPDLVFGEARCQGREEGCAARVGVADAGDGAKPVTAGMEVMRVQIRARVAEVRDLWVCGNQGPVRLYLPMPVQVSGRSVARP